MDKKPLVVSVNIPFCPRRCSFCGASVATGAPTPENPRKGDFAYRGAYLDALARELASMAPDLAGHRVLAAVITGGIPTSCAGNDLGKLVRSLRSSLVWGETMPDGTTLPPQVTLQTVPGMLSADTFDTLRGLGVRRYEFGMGSLDHFEHEALDRPTARDAIHNMRVLLGYAGVDDLGVRLFWGIPGQTEATVRSSIDEALENGAVHVRMEALPLAAGTPLHERFAEKDNDAPLSRAASALRIGGHVKGAHLPNNEERGRLRAAAEEHLAKKGLRVYAHTADGAFCCARPGHESRFDALRAQGCDYVTLGLGGESLVDGLRTANTRDLKRYIAGASDPAQIVETVEDVTLQGADA